MPHTNPGRWFIACLVMVTLRDSILAALGEAAGHFTGGLDGVAFASLAVFFICGDRHPKAEKWPVDWTFFLPGILFPVYVLVTRRWRGAALLIGLAMAIIAAGLIPGWFR